MFTIIFWKDTVERALRAAATSLTAVIGGEIIVFDIGWRALIGIPATAAALEIIFSIASAGVGPERTPAVVRYRHRDKDTEAAPDTQDLPINPPEGRLRASPPRSPQVGTTL